MLEGFVTIGLVIAVGALLAHLGRVVVLSLDATALAVLARVVAQQVTHGVDAEDVVEHPRGFGAQ